MTIARGSAVTAVNGSGTSVATGSYSQPAGEHISVCPSWEGTFTCTGCTDTAGNTYVPETSATNATLGCQVFTAVAPCLGNASNVITANFSGSTAFNTIRVARYTTTAGTTARKDTKGAASSSDTNHPVTAAMNAGDFAVAEIKNFSGATLTGADSGWSLRENGSGDGTIDRIDSPGGTYTAGGTYAGAETWAISAASYTEVSSSRTSKKIPRFPSKGPIRSSYGPLYTFKQGIPAVAGADVTVALTGQSGAFVAGNLTPSTDVPLVGQVGAFVTGTMTPSISVPLLGQAAVFTPGTMTPSTTVPLVGQTGTFTPGVVTATPTVALTGQGVVSAAGTMAPSTAVVLAGQRATFFAGTLTATGGTSTGSGTGGFSANVKFLSPVGNILSKQ